MGQLADVSPSSTNTITDYPLKLWKLVAPRSDTNLLRLFLLQNPPPIYKAPKDFALRAACTPRIQKRHKLRLSFAKQAIPKNELDSIRKSNRLNSNIPVLTINIPSESR